MIRHFIAREIAVFSFYAGFLSCMLFGFVACSPDELIDETPVDETISKETLALNEWMNNTMKEVYLWNNRIPTTLNFKVEPDPKEFYKKMLFAEEDKWSWITNDWASYQKELEGTPVSMGYAPSFQRVGNSEDVFIVVKFVYKNSPADKAGIKRGDIILAINNQKLNTSNCYDLYAGTSYVASFGKYNAETDKVVPDERTVNLKATDFKANPVNYYEVKEIEGKKIGYLVYTDFVSGVNDEFHNTIDKTIDYFRTQSVTNLIVDLRYNPGGEMGNVAYLASSLAPRNTVLDNRVLIRMNYNRNIQEYFQLSKKDSARLVYRFFENNSSLNLNQISFLTSRGTASASEMLIVGLKPYMEVKMVGDTTSGKYTGAWIIPDNLEPRQNWCLMPIVLRYANANGFSNFKDGLVPDQYVKDQLLPALPFGDLQDPVLAKAISEIIGEGSVVAKSAKLGSNFIEYRPAELEYKKNVLFPSDL